MTRYQRIKKAYAAEYHFGGMKAQRIHVGSRGREIIAECRAAIAKPHRRALDKRDARKAYYLGALAGLREARALCAQFRL